MSEATEFIIGSEVACSDGVCGDLRRVVVDPVARAITHLVVEPRHRRGTGHLVPVDLVTSTAKEIQLSCTKAQFNELEPAEETQLLPGASGDWAYEQGEMLSLPYFRLGGSGIGLGMRMGSLGLGGRSLGGMGMAPGPHAVTTDRVPAGEVEVRRGEHVHATDGPSGASEDWSSIPAIITSRTSCSTKATCGARSGSRFPSAR